MPTLRKYRLKLADNPHFNYIELNLTYNKDTGLSFWDYKPMKRGYSCSAQPVKVTRNEGDGYSQTVYVPTQGIKSFLLEVPRASIRSESKAVEMAAEKLRDVLVPHLLSEYNLTVDPCHADYDYILKK